MKCEGNDIEDGDERNIHNNNNDNDSDDNNDNDNNDNNDDNDSDDNNDNDNNDNNDSDDSDDNNDNDGAAADLLPLGTSFLPVGRSPRQTFGFLPTTSFRFQFSLFAAIPLPRCYPSLPLLPPPHLPLLPSLTSHRPAPSIKNSSPLWPSTTTVPIAASRAASATWQRCSFWQTASATAFSLRSAPSCSTPIT